MTELWKGKELAGSIKAEAKELLSTSNEPPKTLAIILPRGDASAVDYASFIAESGEKIGLPTQSIVVNGAKELFSALTQASANPQVGGIIVQRPYPQGVAEEDLQARVPEEKDVDGISFANLGRLFAYHPRYVPATASAMLRLMKHYRLPLKGSRVVIVGRSLAVGRPLWALLLREHATITVCHTRTKDLPAEVSRAEVLCVAAGRAGLITPDMVSSEMVVVDAGYNYLDDGSGPLGDCHPEVGEVAGAYTPVPGGVGPVTTAVLLLHAARAAVGVG